LLESENFKLIMGDTKKVFAGIYKDKGVSNEEADFMILYGDSLCLIFDGISDIFEDVECAENLNRYELVEGYSLGVKKDRSTDVCIWQIRDSGRKHTPEYIIKEGSFNGPRFIASLQPFFKVMS
jgi:hypothetical protein